MKEIKASGKKMKKKTAKITDPEAKMKELISQAEKLATFLLSKHKMHAADPRDGSAVKRRNTADVEQDELEGFR